MAIPTSIYFDLDPFSHAGATESHECSKMFMEQYLLSAGSYLTDHLSQSICAMDETLHRGFNIAGVSESFSPGHDSFSRAPMVEIPFNDSTFVSQSFRSHDSVQSPSPSSVPREPAHKDTSPPDRVNTPLPKLDSNSIFKDVIEHDPSSKKARRGGKIRTVAMERSRLAATKSRRKSKSNTDALEATCNSLEEQNLNLKAELAALVQETLKLKSEILRHASCGDSNIETWVADEARSFVSQIGRQ